MRFDEAVLDQVGPNPVTGVYKKRELSHGGGHAKVEAEAGGTWPQPGNAWSHQKPAEAAVRKSTACRRRDCGALTSSSGGE